MNSALFVIQLRCKVVSLETSKKESQVSAIPSKLIMLRTLTNVPISEYADIRPPKDSSDTQERLSFLKRLRQKPSAKNNNATKTQHLSFNAAVWMSFSQLMHKPVSLWLSYKDATGENTILVDEQCLNESKSAMLSGTVSFQVKGNVEYLRACCGGIGREEPFSLDEIHVRRLHESVEFVDPFAAMMAS
tara:strand:+ start:1241 stop:1807 length:567 start_codon:yes stop_codon:yes gene_type:complete